MAVRLPLRWGHAQPGHVFRQALGFRRHAAALVRGQRAPQGSACRLNLPRGPKGHAQRVERISLSVGVFLFRRHFNCGTQCAQRQGIVLLRCLHHAQYGQGPGAKELLLL